MGPGALVLEDPARDLVTGEKIELRHRDGFFAPGEPLLGDPLVDRVVYRVINDFDAALAARKAGAVDFMGLRPVQYLKQTNDPRFEEQSVKHVDRAGSYTYLGWNQKRAIFQDKRVRQALSHLVDKRNVCDKLLLGLADPVESPIYPGRPEFNSKLPPYAFDPAKAKALLAEAGWSDSDGDGILDKEVDGVRVPLRFEIVSNSGNDDRKNLGLVVVDEFKRAGIDASFRAIDWSILLEKVKSFDYDAVVLGWTNSGTVPPDLFQIWHSSQAVPGGSNHISFKNAEVDGSARGVPRRVRRGQAQGALRPRAGDPLRRAALHVGVRAEVTHGLRPALPRCDLVPHRRDAGDRVVGAGREPEVPVATLAMLRYIVRRILLLVPTFVGDHVHRLRDHPPRAGRSGRPVLRGRARGGTDRHQHAAARRRRERRRRELRRELGLDRPIPVQYALWVGRLVRARSRHEPQGPPAGLGQDPRAPAGDDHDRRDLARDHVRDRDPARHLLGGAAEQSPRPVPDRRDLHAVLAAELLGRRAPDRVLLRRRLLRLVPAGRPALARVQRGLVARAARWATSPIT